MTYKPGDNWIICDISGRRCLMSRSKKTWDGLRVHPDYWYPRHPQLDVKGRPDRPGVVDGRPEGPDRFILSCGWFVRPWFLAPGWFEDCIEELTCVDHGWFADPWFVDPWFGYIWSMRPGFDVPLTEPVVPVLPPISPEDL